MLHAYIPQPSSPSNNDFESLSSSIISTQLHRAQDKPPLSSESLLHGQKVVEILHNGSLYKLQATKLGKLILTK